MRTHFKTFILLAILIIPFAHAGEQGVNLPAMNGLKIRLIPQNPEPLEGVGVKIISVTVSPQIIHLKWSSQTKNKMSEAPWPEYRVKMTRGALQTHGWEEAESICLPHLWQEGFTNLSANSLLWMPPKIVEEGDKKTFSLEPCLLGDDFNYFQKGSEELVEKIRGFRKTLSTIGQFPVEEREMKTFLVNFSKVKILAKKKEELLVVNEERIKIPTMIIGNNYVEYTVLASKQNPLVLSVVFIPNKAPPPIKPYFDFFHEHLGYQITQIQTSQSSSNLPLSNP